MIFQMVSKLSGFFQIISHFPEGLKSIWIFLDHFPFSGQCHNGTDFFRLFPIYRTVSKLSRFFQIIANFLDGFKAVRIFPDHGRFSRGFQNCLEVSRCKSSLTKWFEALHCSSCKSGQKVKVNEMIIKMMAREKIVKIMQIIAYLLCDFPFSDILIIP